MINETIKKQNPDIIHFLTGDFALASYIRHQKSSKICYTVHDMEPHEVENLSFLSPIKRKVINGGYKTCRNAAPNLTTSSKKQFELLRKMYPHKNVAYTNFPSLVTDFIEIGNKCPSEIKNEYSYILFFGNVVEYKGVDNLIAAFESIESSVSTKLVIAGGGATYPTTSKNVIRINRFIDDSEVKSLFERAKLIVYPYKSATMSGVLSLAFFFKKNILLSDVPFFKENASTSTTFFKAGDISDLKEKLLHCLNNNDTIADNAYESTYSINSMVDSYAKFYEEING
ncbi:MAG: glycosyltransferase [Candidatus Saccharibacteria bacterium]|nr:glycosyltransferase [Candidatus Saccharibacteria bacterium]